jgi:UDP-N-acetylmuramoyl-tripeptide--D-alanyl-D-alanine ligase
MFDEPLERIARVLDGETRHAEGRRVRRVVTDSREVGPGTLFVALPGETTDGHRFIAAALDQGAAGVLAESSRISEADRARTGIVLVHDTLKALGMLGAWHRNRMPVWVLAVTGSVGKTTTKDLAAAVLSQKFRTLKTQASRNAEVGLPLTLLDLESTHEVAVIEMAMRGPGQIRDLARIARPDAALITNIGLSHLELLGSQQAIAAAKSEVLDFLPGGGDAILNANDRYVDFLSGRVPDDVTVRFFSEGLKSTNTFNGDYHGLAPRPGSDPPLLGSSFDVRIPGKSRVTRAWAPLIGRHNVRNAVAAIAAGFARGVSLQQALKGLEDAEVSPMRSRLIALRDGGWLLDDAYNASSPEAMMGALNLLAELPGRRKIAVLGNMLELGPASEETHKGLGNLVAALSPDLLVTVGEHARLIGERAAEVGLAGERIVPCETNDQATATLHACHQAGDTILVKGSRGMKMETVVAALMERFGGRSGDA